MKLSYIYKKIYSYVIARRLRKCGRGCIFDGVRRLKGTEKIEVGSFTKIGKDAVLTVWDRHTNKTPCSTRISIGDRCNIGEFCHITAINSITIGNDVLTGRWVTITDNSHGTTTLIDMKTPPLNRKLVSKGPVVIEDNVWIGDKATILPGVHIGKGCVIAANSTVTKSVPAYCVVAGSPATIVKMCSKNEL